MADLPYRLLISYGNETPHESMSTESYVYARTAALRRLKTTVTDPNRRQPTFARIVLPGEIVLFEASRLESGRVVIDKESPG